MSPGVCVAVGEPDPSPERLTLAPVLDLGAAASLARTLTELRGSDLALDGSEVGRLGAQCLQILISARRSWATAGHSLVVENASEHMLAAVAQLGATPFLFHPEDATS